MIIIIIILALLGIGLFFFADEKNKKLNNIATLPIGLEVKHTPNPVKAMKDGRSSYPYTWLFKTTVKAIEDDITIIEFGCFIWYEEEKRWVFSNYTDKPFTNANFAEWYSCPNGKLLKGKEYSDPNNWGGSSEPSEAKSKWYYIGINSKGERVKGEAVIKELAELE